MATRGLRASPEVTAMTSMPLNEKMPTITAVQTPGIPLGMNPPGRSVRLWKPTAGPTSPKIVAAPRMMNRTIATTLIRANHDSTVPKLLTERELKYSRIAQNPSDQFHTGMPGNQNCMYRPAATDSPPIAITCAIQYV